MRILVLGVGNILLTDEAIGVRIVEALEQRYTLPDFVEILDGGTAGMELLGDMASRDHFDHCRRHRVEKERAGNHYGTARR